MLISLTIARAVQYSLWLLFLVAADSIIAASLGITQTFGENQLTAAHYSDLVPGVEIYLCIIPGFAINLCTGLFITTAQGKSWRRRSTVRYLGGHWGEPV